MNKEKRQLLEMLEQLEGTDSLIEFIRLNNKDLSAPYHLYPLFDLFRRAETEQVRAVTSVPPRFGKTLSILNLCARYIYKYPEKTVIYVTYAASLARSKSRICRDMALKLGIKLNKSSKALNEWRTPQGGGFIAVGVGGQLTGQGADLLVVDDPIKNRQDAESLIIKDGLEAWFTSTASTRLEPGASIIVNATRWSPDDLIGRLIENDDPLNPLWEIVNMPAINDNNESLWPERWSVEALKGREKEIGEYDFSSLYQGSPIPKDGVAFKGPTYYEYANVINGRWAISVDSAATTKTYSDNSAITVVCAQGVGEKQIIDIVYQWAGKLEIPDLIEKIKEVSRLYAANIYIESNGIGKAVAQMLRKLAPTLKIYEKNSGTDKFTRALPTIAAWNDGRIRIPKDEQWTKQLLKEMSKFTPAGSGNYHDDTIDSLVVAFEAINKRVELKQKKEMEMFKYERN